jgi:cytidine deaminase
MASEKLHEQLVTQETQALLAAAWDVRTRAYVIGPTRVGCAVRSVTGEVFVGCNVEHRFRSHDVHAEVNAITNMISCLGQSEIVAIAIAAERERFTPCGSCMDWILQFAASDCVVYAQSQVNGPVKMYTANELMPFYPY